VGEILDLGVELGVVQKSGSWFAYNGDKLGQGRDAVKNILLDNPELSEEIENKIRDIVKGEPEKVAIAMLGD
jgi:recombination protein RecA